MKVNRRGLGLRDKCLCVTRRTPIRELLRMVSNSVPDRACPASWSSIYDVVVNIHIHVNRPSRAYDDNSIEW